MLKFILYNRDCYDVIDYFPKINLVVSDPPYPDYYIDEFDYYDGITDIFNFFRCRQFIFWSAKVEFPITYTAKHVWDKITGAANQYDYIYERNGYKTQKVFRGHRINSTVSASIARETFYGHKSQKPISLMSDIIKHSKLHRGFIFDPFAGTCTTGISILQTNLKFIGCEINDNNFYIALDRVYENLNINKYSLIINHFKNGNKTILLYTFDYISDASLFMHSYLKKIFKKTNYTSHTFVIVEIFQGDEIMYCREIQSFNNDVSTELIYNVKFQEYNTFKNNAS